MSDDDDLRRLIHRDVSKLPVAPTHEVLAGMSASLDRVARRRIATIVASAVVLSGGAVAAAGALVQPASDTLVLSSGDRAGTASVSSSEPAPSESAAPAESPPSTMPPVSVGDGSGGAVGRVDGSGRAEPPADSLAPSIPVTTVEVPTTVERRDIEPTGPVTGTDPLPTSTAPAVIPAPSPPTQPAVSAPASTTAVTTTTPTVPTPTVPTTVAVVSPGGIRFDSACGWVLADIESVPPTIIEVVPAVGYRYRLEDSDGDRIVVQFTGSGEDCELVVRAGRGDRDD
jgi:hypothetical protein